MEDDLQQLERKISALPFPRPLKPRIFGFVVFAVFLIPFAMICWLNRGDLFTTAAFLFGVKTTGTVTSLEELTGSQKSVDYKIHLTYISRDGISRDASAEVSKAMFMTLKKGGDVKLKYLQGFWGYPCADKYSWFNAVWILGAFYFFVISFPLHVLKDRDFMRKAVPVIAEVVEIKSNGGFSFPQQYSIKLKYKWKDEQVNISSGCYENHEGAALIVVDPDKPVIIKVYDKSLFFQYDLNNDVL